MLKNEQSIYRGKGFSLGMLYMVIPIWPKGGILRDFYLRKVGCKWNRQENQKAFILILEISNIIFEFQLTFYEFKNAIMNFKSICLNPYRNNLLISIEILLILVKYLIAEYIN